MQHTGRLDGSLIDRHARREEVGPDLGDLYTEPLVQTGAGVVVQLCHRVFAEPDLLHSCSQYIVRGRVASSAVPGVGTSGIIVAPTVAILSPMPGIDELPELELVPPGRLRDTLLDAVIRGVKTATSRLEVMDLIGGMPAEAPGTRMLLRDSAGRPAAAVEITEVATAPLGEVTDRVAR